jgi:hypothetical protein
MPASGVFLGEGASGCCKSNSCLKDILGKENFYKTSLDSYSHTQEAGYQYTDI